LVHAARLALQEVFQRYHFLGRGREMFPVLRAILLDRGCEERQTVQVKEFAGIGSVLRGYNSTSQLLVDRRSRDAEPLGSSAGTYDSRWLFLVHVAKARVVNLATVVISKNSRNPENFAILGTQRSPFGNAQQDAQVFGLFSLVYRLQLWSIRGTIHLENDDR
jgi:hypothetical protein